MSPDANVDDLSKESGLYVLKTSPSDTVIAIPPVTSDASTTEELKPANSWFRWNLAWFVFFCLVFIPMPFWLYPLTCVGGFAALSLVSIWQCLTLVACGVSASITMLRMYVVRQKSWFQKEDLRPETLVHMMVMAGYKEPLSVMMATLDSLKEQSEAKRLFVVIGLEERTPDFQTKKDFLLKRYYNVFLHTMVTQHPYGIPGETPGKCSNANYATRQGVQVLTEMGLHNLDRCTYSTCDTDNVFSPKYFEYLAYDFLRREDRHEVVWQAPLLYNYNLDQRPFFVRVTGILRAIFMMGILIPQNINTMSVFSMSLQLIEKGYIHPGYQMDDIINIVRRMIKIHKLVKIRLIPYPVVSGPTSGANLKQEVVEWARQARRWTIGAAEVFHYFCIKWREYDTWSGIVYAILFTHYYGFVICGMSLFSFTSLIASYVFQFTGTCVPSQFLGSEYYVYLPLIGVVVSYIFFLWAFLLDALGTRLICLKEDIGFFRNLLHWLSAPLVLLAYSCVEYYSIAEVALFGKAVCKHNASKKEGLVPKF